AAFGMNQKLGARVSRALSSYVFRVNSGVYVTFADPYFHVRPASAALDVRAQKEVREKQDGFLRRNRIDHVHGISGSTAVITFCFDLRRRIHVRYHDRARKFG